MIDSRFSRTTPDFTNRERQRVSSISGSNHLRNTQQTHDHGGDLSLISATTAGYGCLNLGWRTPGNGDIASPGGNNRHGRSLRSTHNGTNIMLTENAFYDDSVRAVLIEQHLELIGK
jgi:hypothetical protein